MNYRRSWWFRDKIDCVMALYKVYVVKRGGVCRVHARKVKGYPVSFPKNAVGVSVQDSRSSRGAKQNVGWDTPEKVRRSVSACK